MNNQERKFRVIKEFRSFSNMNVYKVGDIITTIDINDLVEHFDDKAGMLLYHLQEITPADDVLYDMIYDKLNDDVFTIVETEYAYYLDVNVIDATTLKKYSNREEIFREEYELLKELKGRKNE